MTRASIVISFLLVNTAVQGGVVEKSPRINGGENAKQGEFPFVVALSNPNYKTDLATATVLTHNWLMTTGWTCYLIGQVIQAIVGSVTLDKGGKFYQVAYHLKHPDWDKTDDAGLANPNDVCLVKLKVGLPYNDDINQVTLPPPDYDFPQGTSATVMGWGTTTDDYHDVSNHLKVIRNMTAYQSNNCPTDLTNRPPFDGQFCATSGKNGVTPCDRDQGSPLLYNNTIQIGIMSYNTGGCSRGTSSIYAKVSHYVPWIVAALGDEAKFLKIAKFDDVPKN